MIKTSFNALSYTCSGCSNRLFWFQQGTKNEICFVYYLPALPYFLPRALYYIALHCTSLHFTAVNCTALHCTALHCTVLHCTALQCSEVHCTALHCTELHCTTLHCSSLQFTAQHCTKLQSTALSSVSIIKCLNLELVEYIVCC